ncbi:MAG: restriction endonuclease [Verrucomicrobiales bacterium]|nr:restriction endonuclease [Verrucomicrobiales bacterium]
MRDDVRDALRRRAGARCEYCHLPERFATLRFQQDHVIALKHRGSNDLENLAWSCADCNAHKGSDLTGFDPVSRTLERLFNPRVHQWVEHFGWDGPELTVERRSVEPRSHCCKSTVRKGSPFVVS